MKIFLTGGGGFLGGYLIQQLIEDGNEVFALSRSVRSSNHPNLKWIDMDLAEGLVSEQLPKSVDGIIHLAQSPEYRNGSDGEAHVLQVNVVAYAQLLKYAETAGASRFVTASTGSVYEPFKGPMLENSLPTPTGFYGSSKLAAESLAGAYTGRMSICNLRVFFLFGPNQKNSLIARLIETIRNSEPVTLPVKGDGLVFVPTLAENTAHVFKVAFEKGWKGTYNVSSPHAISVKDLALKIGQAMNKEVVFKRSEQKSPSQIVPPLGKLAGIYNLDQFHTVEESLQGFSFHE